jgi:hypothetical protein
MAMATVCNRSKSMPAPRHLQFAVRILDTNEEELIAKSERQMLQEWRV